MFYINYIYLTIIKGKSQFISLLADYLTLAPPRFILIGMLFHLISIIKCDKENAYQCLPQHIQIVITVPFSVRLY